MIAMHVNVVSITINVGSDMCFTSLNSMFCLPVCGNNCIDLQFYFVYYLYNIRKVHPYGFEYIIVNHDSLVRWLTRIRSKTEQV